MDDDASVEQHQVRMVIDELSTDECWRHLAQVPTGRLCFVEDGEPMVLPFNHALDGHSIVLRTAGGTALHRLASGATVAYEADATVPVTCEGWSVVVRGHLAEITDDRERADVARLGLHPWASGRRDHYLRLRPWAVTGRAIRATAVDEESEVVR
jgi:nitroimidazol reductase NimA-like FMN-containing flavoprotein (pyridoxamine 5'-phosphate oxidase superfamily)